MTKKPHGTPPINLPMCEVYAIVTIQGRESDATFVGYLLFETKRFVTLVNNVRAGADFGPLKTRRDDHVTPECMVIVIPRRRVTRIEKFKVSA